MHPIRILLAAAVIATAGLATAPAGAAQSGGIWVWPVDPPVVVRGFEPPPQPWLAGHRGVDLAAERGQPVRSAGAGVVAFAGAVAGRPVISISHGALRTTYEPVDPAVAPGETVSAGTIIGTVTRAAAHCALDLPCVHWGVRQGDRYLDPLALLRHRQPVRLMPLWTSGRPATAAGREIQGMSPARSQGIDSGPAVGALAAGVLAVLAAGALLARTR